MSFHDCKIAQTTDYFKMVKVMVRHTVNLQWCFALIRFGVKSAEKYLVLYLTKYVFGDPYLFNCDVPEIEK